MHSADCIYTHTCTHIIMKEKVIYLRGSGATDGVKGNRARKREQGKDGTSVLVYVQYSYMNFSGS